VEQSLVFSVTLGNLPPFLVLLLVRHARQESLDLLLVLQHVLIAKMDILVSHQVKLLVQHVIPVGIHSSPQLL